MEENKAVNNPQENPQENVPQQAPPETTATTTATERVTKAGHALRQEVATRLATCGNRVRGMVLDHLERVELDNRESAVLAVLEVISNKERELRKLEGSGQEPRLSLSGEKLGTMTYDKAQLKAISDLKESIEKLHKAIEVAFGDKNDFSKVLELAKNKGTQPPV